MKTKMKLLRKFLAANTLVAALLAPAIWAAERPPTIQWQKNFGGTNDDYLATIQQTSDGGYILGGTSVSGVSGNKTSVNYGSEDWWVVKLDGDGNKVWENSFGGIGRDILNGQCLQQTRDGGYILGGWSDSDISGNKTTASYGLWDYWVIKLDADGNKVWENSFGGDEDEQLSSVLQTSDGGYLIGGSSNSGVSGNKTTDLYGGTSAGYRPSDYWVVKLDADGNKVWDKSFGGNGGDSLSSLHRTSDGGYILGGSSDSDVSGNKTSTNYGGGDYWVVKLDAAGNIIWDKSYGGTGGDQLVSIQPISGGGYIVGGSSGSLPSGNKTSPTYIDRCGGCPDYWVLKLDSTGNIVWDKSFGGVDGDSLFDVRKIGSGFLLGGISASGVSGNKTTPHFDNFGNYDCWVVNLDVNGNKVWEASYGGIGGDFLYSIEVTSTGYILGASSGSGVSGNKTTTNYGGIDFWIVKLEGPPRITTQPQNLSATVGDSVTFNVAVAGVVPLNYRWLFNGTNIAGATGPSLTLTNTTHAQAGFYSVIVTNAFGTVTSTRAQLTFNFLTLKMYAGLTIDGEISQTYRIEYLPAIEGQNNWQLLATVTLTNTPYLYIDREAPISIQRFYRALLAP